MVIFPGGKIYSLEGNAAVNFTGREYSVDFGPKIRPIHRTGERGGLCLDRSYATLTSCEGTKLSQAGFLLDRTRL